MDPWLTNRSIGFTLPTPFTHHHPTQPALPLTLQPTAHHPPHPKQPLQDLGARLVGRDMELWALETALEAQRQAAAQAAIPVPAPGPSAAELDAAREEAQSLGWWWAMDGFFSRDD